MALTSIYFGSDSKTKIHFEEKLPNHKITNKGDIVQGYLNPTFNCFASKKNDPGSGTVPPPDSIIFSDSNTLTLTADETALESGAQFVGWYSFPSDMRMDGDILYWMQNRISTNRTITYADIARLAHKDLRSNCYAVIACYRTKYRVNYDATGGTASKSTDWVPIGYSITNLPTATKTGFRFDGWFYSDGSAVDQSGMLMTPNRASSPITVKAGWTNQNPGNRDYVLVGADYYGRVDYTWTTTSTIQLNQRNDALQLYCSSASSSMPDQAWFYDNDNLTLTAIRTIGAFTGWYTFESDTQLFGNVIMLATKRISTNATLTLAEIRAYASKETRTGKYFVVAGFATRVRLTYALDGGTLDRSFDDVTTTVDFQLPLARKSGFVLSGWFDDNGVLIGKPGTFKRFNANQTLHAVWFVPQYPHEQTGLLVASDSPVMLQYEGSHPGTLDQSKFNDLIQGYTEFGGDSGNVPDAIIYEVDPAGTLWVEAQASTKDGYSFKGWFTFPSDRAVYDNLPGQCTLRISTNRKITRDVIERNAHKDTRTNQFIIFAVYRPLVTVYYNGNGGSVERASDTVAMGTKLTLPLATRSGRKFGGWWSLPDGGQYIGDVSEDGVFRDTFIAPQVNTTIYAQWTPDVNHIGVQFAATGEDRISNHIDITYTDGKSNESRYLDIRSQISRGYVSCQGVAYGWDSCLFTNGFHMHFGKLTAQYEYYGVKGWYTLPADTFQPTIDQATVLISSDSFITQNQIVNHARKDTRSGNYVVVPLIGRTTDFVRIIFDSVANVFVPSISEMLKPTGYTSITMPDGRIVNDDYIFLGWRSALIEQPYIGSDGHVPPGMVAEFNIRNAGTTIHITPVVVRKGSKFAKVASGYSKRVPVAIYEGTDTDGGGSTWLDVDYMYGELSVRSYAYVTPAAVDFGWVVEALNGTTANRMFIYFCCSTRNYLVWCDFIFDGVYTIPSDKPNTLDDPITIDQCTSPVPFSIYPGEYKTTEDEGGVAEIENINILRYAHKDTTNGNYILLAKYIDRSDAKYNLTYDLDGGQFDDAYPTEVGFDTQFTIPEPKKTGATFAGWEISGDLMTLFQAYPTFNVLKSQRTAGVINYSPCHSTDGGVTWTYDESPVYSSKWVLNTPGVYTFRNIADARNNCTVHFKALWSIETKTIYLSPNGGTMIQKKSGRETELQRLEITMEYGRDFEIPIFLPNRGATSEWLMLTREDYSLYGFNITPDIPRIYGDVDFVMGRSYPYSRFNHLQTIYATWYGNWAVIIFSANGGIWTGWYNQPQFTTIGGRKGVAIGSSSLPSNPSRTGYTFAGWYTEPDGGELADLSTYQPMIVYAHWNESTEIILVDPTETNSNYSAGQFTVGVAKSLPSFASTGWSTPTGSTFDTVQSWIDDDGNVYANGASITLQQGYGTKFLYANWKRRTVTITFNANGGQTEEASRTINYGGQIGRLPIVTNDGKELDGWYTSASGGTKIESDSVFTSNATLYAHWGQDGGETWTYLKYKIKLELNGGALDSGYELKYVYGYVTPLPTEDQVTKSGHDFLGWYDNPEFTGTAKTSIPSNAKGTKTFYARWS